MHSSVSWSRRGAKGDGEKSRPLGVLPLLCPRLEDRLPESGDRNQISRNIRYEPMYPLGRDDMMYEGFCSELYEEGSTVNAANYS